MLSLSATMLALAAVALCSCAGRATAAALACAVIASACLVLQLGLVPGLISAAVLGMASASVLVLVLPPRPDWAPPLAYACALAGSILGLGGML